MAGSIDGKQNLLPFDRDAIEEEVANRLSIWSEPCQIDDILESIPSLNVNILCDIIEKLILQRRVRKIEVFYALTAYYAVSDWDDVLNLDELDIILRANTDRHVADAGNGLDPAQVAFGGFEASNFKDGEGTERITELYEVVRRHSDELYILFCEIEKILHYKVCEVLFDKHGSQWFAWISESIRKRCAELAEEERSFNFEAAGDEDDEELGEYPGVISVQPGAPELMLFRYTTIGQLRQIIDKNWRDLADRVPIAYENKKAFLNELENVRRRRNEFMHPSNMSLDIWKIEPDEYIRLAKMRENLNLSNWR